MKQYRSRIFLVVFVLLATFALVYPLGAQEKGKPSSDPKFEEYRQAIKKAHGIDIRNFRDSLKGGKADGQPVTKYPLDQLIMGIKVEQEHTTSKSRALEISMDHLEEFPDYYTRLEKMEHEAEEAMKQKKPTK